MAEGPDHEEASDQCIFSSGSGEESIEDDGLGSESGLSELSNETEYFNNKLTQ